MSKTSTHATDNPFRLSTRRARSFWPTPRQEALLRAALLDPPRLQNALDQWQAPTSLDCVDYPSLTILPLLYRNLSRYDVASGLRERIKGVYRWSWHRNQLLLATLCGALAVLRQANVEAFVIKGVPLSLRVYADVGARVMGDADIVVHRDNLQRSLEALGSVGWVPERDVTADLLGSLGGVNVRNKRGHTVDLHWHVLPDNYDTRRDELLLQSAEQIQIGAERAHCLNPTDHLLEVICHGLSWAANSPLHWVADAVTLLRAEQARLDWDRLAEQVELNGRTYTIWSGLQYLVARFDAPVPASALARIERVRVGVRERMGFWFAQRSDDKWPWGRAPVVVASYLRASRAQERRWGPLGLIRFASARADCSPTQWLCSAAIDGCRHLGQVVSRRLGRASTGQHEVSA